MKSQGKLSRNILQNVIVAAVYFLIASLSLFLAFENSNASPVWPASGFALAMILLLGYRVAPGILCGAFAANMVGFLSNHTCDLPTAFWISSLIALGNTGEAVAGSYMLRRFVQGVNNNDFFQRASSIFWFLYVAVVMSVISAMTGPAALLFSGIIAPEQYLNIAFTWWTGDVSGVLLVTPLILAWRGKPLKNSFSVNRKNGSRLEFVVIFLAVILGTGTVFDGWFMAQPIFRWSFWAFPALVWAAVRLKQHESVTAVFFCSLIALLGTLNGRGPFSELLLHKALISVEGFTSVAVMTTLLLNSIVRELRETETKLRSAHDELEVRISERTARLREQKEFVETLFNSIEDLIAVLDRHGNYIAVNKKTEEMYHLKRSDFIGKNALELFPISRTSGMYDNYLKALKGEVVHDLTYFSQMTKRYFENFYIPLRDDVQEIYGVLIIGHDITDIKKSEELAKRSEEKFIKLFDSSPFGVTLAEMSSGKFVEVNDNFLEMMGYSRQELIGHSSLEFDMVSEAERKRIMDELEKNGSVRNLEIEVKKKSGEKIWVMQSSEIITVDKDKYFLNAFNEINQRKRAEEQLKESEERIQSIFRSAPYAVIVIDTGAKIIGWNPQAETIFGWKAKEIIGSYLQDIIIPEHLREADNELSRFLEAGTTQSASRAIEMAALHKNGYEFFVSISVSVTMIKGQKHFTAFVSDITEFRKVQEAVKQKSMELERSNRELEQFGYAASHDLQEPLRSVIAYLQIIEKRYKDKLDDDGREFIQRSVDSAVRMRTLINDLLSYSRAGTMDIEFNKVDSGHAVNVALDNLHKLIEENKGAVVFETPMPVVTGSDLQLTLLFQNLISNGIKYKNEKPPRVSLSAEETDSHWQFSVKDNGMGIDKEDLERIFLIFQRLHTRQEFSGTGIGLALCKKIVQRHGGKLWVESEPGKGSTFYFTILKRPELVPA